MIRFSALFSIAVSALVCTAVGQSPPNVKPEAANEAVLPSALAEFLDSAVKDGVLRPPGAMPLQAHETAEDAAEASSPIEIEAAPSTEIACSSENPLEFQSSNSFSNYQDLGQYLSVLSRQDADITELNKLIEGYFLLGMFAEARAALRRFDAPEAVQYRALADLLEYGKVNDISIFTDLAFCHDSANLWEALALIVTNDPDGVIKFAGEIPAFRRLAIRLRIQTAEIALPALRASGDFLTASKVASAFSSEDKTQSSRLRLQIALHEARLSGRDLPLQGDHLLAQSGSVVPTMRAILAGEKRVSDAEALLLLNRVDGALRRANNDRDVAVVMSFAMQEYASRSDHQAIVGMLKNPRLSGAAYRDEMLDQFVTMIRRDLTGRDPELIFRSTAILLEQADLLRGHPDYEDLLETATSTAIEQRSQSLAVHLIHSQGSETGTGALIAEMALRRNDFESVYKLAAERTTDHTISKIASLAAIREGNQQLLTVYLKALNPSFQEKVDLIEEDALARHWVLPDEIYESARASADGEVLDRLIRLDRLRLMKLGRAETPKITSLSESFDRAAQAQERLEQRGP